MENLKNELLSTIKEDKFNLQSLGYSNKFDKHSFSKSISILSKRPEKYIAVLCDNTSDCFSIYISCILTNKILVPINPFCTKNEIETICNNISIELIIFDNVYKEKIPETCPYIDSKKLFNNSSTNKILNIEKEIKINDTPLILFSSGTTGPAKPVMIKKSGIEFLLNNMALKLEINNSDRLLVVTHLAFFQTFWMSLLVFIKGGTILFGNRIDYKNYWNLLSENNITTAVLVPTIINKLSANMSQPLKLNLNSLRFIVCGGEIINVKSTQKLYDNIEGLQIINAYGMSETTAVCSVLTDNIRTKIGSVGKPLKQVKIKIDDKDSEGVGRIKVNTPAIMKGYYPLEDRINNKNEWFDTGDLGYIDLDGYLYVTGREKLTINKGGVKINPLSIENILDDHPMIKESLVTKTNDEVYGEVLIAKVISNSILRRQDILDYLKSRLPKYCLPSKIEFVQNIPLTSSGKRRR